MTTMDAKATLEAILALPAVRQVLVANAVSMQTLRFGDLLNIRKEQEPSIIQGAVEYLKSLGITSSADFDYAAAIRKHYDKIVAGRIAEFQIAVAALKSEPATSIWDARLGESHVTPRKPKNPDKMSGGDYFVNSGKGKKEY